MTRSRFVTGVLLLALCGLGLTALMAARAAADKPGSPAGPGRPGKSTVCLGYVDSKDKPVPLVPLNYPLPSRVTKVLAKEGDMVTKDQRLLELDTEAIELKVQAANIAIEAARKEQAKAEAIVRQHATKVKSLELELQSQEAVLTQKKKELESARYEVSKGRRSQVDQDAAEAAMTAAEKKLAAARTEWEGLKPEEPTYLVDLAKENVKKAQNAKAEAEHALRQAACVAPADGRLLRSFVSEGSIFGPGSNREPAFLFVKKGPLIVRAEFIQEFAGRVSVGQAAEIVDEADDTVKWTGTVIEVPQHFLPKRLGNTGLIDIMPVTDDRVLECQVSIDLVSGGPVPRFGQKVRVKLPAK